MWPDGVRFPWHKEMFNWLRFMQCPVPLRALLEAKGLARPQPALLPHVIIADPVGAPLLRQSRWRVYTTPKGCKAKYQIQRGKKGVPLQKIVMPDAEIVRFANGNGCDVRRDNLISTTWRQLALTRAKKKAKAVEKKAALQVAA